MRNHRIFRMEKPSILQSGINHKTLPWFFFFFFFVVFPSPSLCGTDSYLFSSHGAASSQWSCRGGVLKKKISHFYFLFISLPHLLWQTLPPLLFLPLFTAEQFPVHIFNKASCCCWTWLSCSAHSCCLHHAVARDCLRSAESAHYAGREVIALLLS